MESTGSRLAPIRKSDSGYKPCTCESSKCMMRYCGCIKKNRYCSEDCSCEDCSNKDPTACSTKEGGENKTTGCRCVQHCTRSKCMCVTAGVSCTSRCRCVECQNRFGKSGDKSNMKSGIQLDLKLSL